MQLPSPPLNPPLRHVYNRLLYSSHCIMPVYVICSVRILFIRSCKWFKVQADMKQYLDQHFPDQSSLLMCYLVSDSLLLVCCRIPYYCLQHLIPRITSLPSIIYNSADGVTIVNSTAGLHL